MGTIYWTNFDWPSFATMFTGIIAVGGAVKIGLKQAALTARQVAIAEKQNDILAAQNKLSEQTLQNESFDRRLALYMEIVQFLAAFEIGAETTTQSNNFYLAIDRSKFLFSSAVQPLFRECIETVVELDHLRKKYGQKSDAGNDEHQKRISELVADVKKMTTEFGEKLRPEMAIKV